ncbi:kinase-like domain-containing protein [Zychaea mexicana]|uniref:kinase-like domain-containing protein n=1 Tax=Zychaea mexicana TaxID=64656 RepID=UPI0022FF0BE0|nr:kinase-like domain-containing protein [Zychaea mexicana]KAI9497662.1 kinase-like domain-containing protein [Zychaea mexicana]
MHPSTGQKRAGDTPEIGESFEAFVVTCTLSVLSTSASLRAETYGASSRWLVFFLPDGTERSAGFSAAFTRTRCSTTVTRSNNTRSGGRHFHGKQYIQFNHVKSTGSCRVCKVMGFDRTEYALKNVNVTDPSRLDIHLEEVELLQQLQGNDSVTRMYAFELCRTSWQLHILFEYGEINFASLLCQDHLNIHRIKYFWKKQNIVHADLKPSNFVLVKGVVKIIDFGIAKAIDEIRTFGTPSYMAPEAVTNLMDTAINDGLNDSDMMMTR